MSHVSCMLPSYQSVCVRAHSALTRAFLTLTLTTYERIVVLVNITIGWDLLLALVYNSKQTHVTELSLFEVKLSPPQRSHTLIVWETQFLLQWCKRGLNLKKIYLKSQWSFSSMIATSAQKITVHSFIPLVSTVWPHVFIRSTVK